MIKFLYSISENIGLVPQRQAIYKCNNFLQLAKQDLTKPFTHSTAVLIKTRNMQIRNAISVKRSSCYMFRFESVVKLQIVIKG